MATLASIKQVIKVILIKQIIRFPDRHIQIHFLRKLPFADLHQTLAVKE